jgi:adenylate cyclase
VVLLLIFINYKQSSDTLVFIANKLMEQVSSNVYQRFTREIQKAENDSKLSQQLIEQDLINLKKRDEIVSYTLDLAYHFYLVQSVYIANADGNYVQAEYDTDETIKSQVVDSSVFPHKSEYIYRNANLDVIRREFKTTDYEPRKRPWFIAATKAKEPIWTDIYAFQPSGEPGITLATPLYSAGGQLRAVLGFDISLTWLSWYLSEQNISPNAVILIISKDNTVIAHSRRYDANEYFKMFPIENLTRAWVRESFKLYKRHHKTVFNFEYEGKDYLATYRPLPELKALDLVIGIVVPKDDFTANLKRNSLLNVAMSLAILGFGIFLVSAFITRAIRPMKDLVKETNKIKRLQLDGDVRIKTVIKEIMELSEATYAMKIGLRSFRKYIPATLVRKLIESGEDVRIGGTKKPLTILFTDIVDFTQIAESMEPNQLMEHMCEYFEELSIIIAKQKGTIDKYIGDSIMAFWGAPVAVSFATKRAAQATLDCKKRLAELNANWQKQNMPLLLTRFGLHKGESIVGNVGSSERLNYTALGDVTNVASRLEGINKVYGTTIIVSEAVYQEVKKYFVLRKIDIITVKGKKISETIYELMAENRNELTFDLEAYESAYTLAFEAYTKGEWDKAIPLFEACLQVFPEDTVAHVFIARCEHYKIMPPKHWRGIWRITT